VGYLYGEDKNSDFMKPNFFDVLTSIVSFLWETQHRKDGAYGVKSGPTNRNTVTKASRRGVAT
jgi:hypothetical protein